MDEPLLLRVPEAAVLLRISRAKLYQLLATGQVPSFRVGGRTRIPVAGLRRWLDEQTESALRAATAPVKLARDSRPRDHEDGTNESGGRSGNDHDR